MLKFENIVSVTDILRNGKSYFDDLANGHQKEILAMKNSQPAAVLLSPEEYENLINGKNLIAQYQIMRMNIMSMSLSENNPFEHSYIYAWYNGVFPWLHDSADWHEPFGGCFAITGKEVDAVHDILCDRWDEQNPITFYELEDHFGTRSRKTTLDRMKLVYICRYLFLDSCPDGLDGDFCKSFDIDMWRTLVTNGKCPSEAHSIVRSKKEQIYFM